MKPVFKENKGNGVPDDLCGVVVLRDGEVLNGFEYEHKSCGWLWDIEGRSTDILWYETKREIKAKYKKEPCIICRGLVEYTLEEIFAVDEKKNPCVTCNSRGYKMGLIK